MHLYDVIERRVRGNAPTTFTAVCCVTTSFSRGTPIDDQIAHLVIAHMLFLSRETRRGSLPLYLTRRAAHDCPSVALL